jgi:small subunit ribosomal protein S18
MTTEGPTTPGAPSPQPHVEGTPDAGAPRPAAPMAPRGPRPSYGSRPSYGGGDRGAGGPGGPRRPRRKVCSFCVDKVQKIDYKDVGRIRRYISERGKIDPRRKSGSCAKHQRMLTTALKRARFMALLPYTAEHVRGLMSPQARAMAGGPPPPKPERGPWRPAGEFRPAGDFRPAPPRPFNAPPGAPAPQAGAPAAPSTAPQPSAQQPAAPQPAAPQRRSEGEAPTS